MKNRKKGILGISAIILAMSSGIAYAEGVRPYVGLELGGLQAKSADAEGMDANLSLFQGGIYGGVDLNQYMALELGYDRSSSKRTSAEIMGLGVSVNQYYQMGYVDAIGKLPLTERLDLLGSAGIAYVSDTADATVSASGVSESASVTMENTGLKVGLGGQYHLNDDWAVRTKVDYINVENGLWKYGLGVQHRF